MIDSVVERSPEVVREAAIRAGRVHIAGAAAEYRAWLADGAHKSGADPIEATDVVSECSHERLAGDPCPSPDRVWPHPHPCACWDEPNGFTPPPTPDLMSTFKETVMPTDAPAAPLGYLADGITPRRRRAPATAKKVRAARKARLKLASPPARGTSKAVPKSMLPRVIAEIDAEIARLTKARDVLAELIA